MQNQLNAQTSIETAARGKGGLSILEKLSLVDGVLTALFTWIGNHLRTLLPSYFFRTSSQTCYKVHTQLTSGKQRFNGNRNPSKQERIKKGKKLSSGVESELT